MAQLPKNLPWPQASTQWSSLLDPIISNPFTNPRILPNISLTTGVTIINHGLQRNMQGWVIVDINAGITIYRSAPMNSTTLTLTCSGSATANILVF